MDNSGEQDPRVQDLLRKVEELKASVDLLAQRVDRLEGRPVKGPSVSPVQVSRKITPSPPPPPSKVWILLKKFATEGNILNKVGALTIILAIGLLFKVLTEYNLIGPSLRVLLGLLLGGFLFAAGEYVQKKEWLNTASGLFGAGMGVFFISFSAAQHLYQLIPATVSFPLYLLVTAVIFAQAIRLHSEIICIMGLLGGYLSPYLVSTGSGNYVGLHSFLLILNGTVLVISLRKNWVHLKWLSFLFTQIYLLAWGFNLPVEGIFRPIIPHIYNRLPYFVFFVILHFFFFLGLSVHWALKRKEFFQKKDILLCLGNGVLSFGILYWKWHQSWRPLLGPAAIVLSFVFLKLADHSMRILREKGKDKEKEKESTWAYQTFIGMGAWFLISAVPLICSGPWITVAWSLEGVLMAYLSTRGRLAHVDFSYLYPHVLGILLILMVRLLFWDQVLLPPDFSAGTTPPTYYLPFFHDSKTLALLVATLSCFFILKMTRNSSLWKKAMPSLHYGLFLLGVLVAFHESSVLDDVLFGYTYPFRIPGFFPMLWIGLVSGLFFLFLGWKPLAGSGSGDDSPPFFISVLIIFLGVSFLVMLKEALFFGLSYGIAPSFFYIFGLHLASLFLLAPILLGIFLLRGPSLPSMGKSFYWASLVFTVGLSLLLVRYEWRALLFHPPLGPFVSETHRFPIFEMATSCTYTLMAFFLFLKGLKKHYPFMVNLAYFLFFAAGFKIYLLDLSYASRLYRVLSLILYGLLLLFCSYYARKIQATGTAEGSAANDDRKSP